MTPEERAHETLWKLDGGTHSNEDFVTIVAAAISAARDEALEEAARLADAKVEGVGLELDANARKPYSVAKMQEADRLAWQGTAVKNVAFAIRALKENNAQN